MKKKLKASSFEHGPEHWAFLTISKCVFEPFTLTFNYLAYAFIQSDLQKWIIASNLLGTNQQGFAVHNTKFHV